MPVSDVTIDTNVLEHAHNPKEHRQVYSICMIKYLLTSDELLCFDYSSSKEFDLNDSFIYTEYNEHLKQGMLGYNFIQQMLASKRIKPVDRKTEQAAKKLIEQKISNKETVDRTFLKVAHNSTSKEFISHDFKDFKKSIRKEINKKIGVIFLEARDKCPTP